LSIGKGPNDTRAATDFAQDAFQWVIRPDPPPVLLGERVVRQCLLDMAALELKQARSRRILASGPPRLVTARMKVLEQVDAEVALLDQAAGARSRRRVSLIRTNNPLEHILREIRRRTRVVGAFPDGQSALNLGAARLRHVAGTEWSTKRYLSMDFLKDHQPTRTTA
jgi:transposase-like protein